MTSNAWGAAAPREAGRESVGGGGPGEPLRADLRQRMERAFGVDFSAVRVHHDGAAGELGAEAYTRGRVIHFAPGRYQPDTESGLELLGHELAHVVQQAAGRVRATGQARGVALNEDEALEREADEQGARAARGERVGPAGAPAALAAPSGPPVAQGFFKLDVKEARALAQQEHGTTFVRQKTKKNSFFDKAGLLRTDVLDEIPALRISDDGQLAIQDTSNNTNAKNFFASKAQLVSANKKLKKVGSAYRLTPEGGGLTVPDLRGEPHALLRVVGVKAEDDKERGTSLQGPSQCIEMAQTVMGRQRHLRLRCKVPPIVSKDDHGNLLGAFVARYGESQGKPKEREKVGHVENVLRAKAFDQYESVEAPRFAVTLKKKSDYGNLFDASKVKPYFAVQRLQRSVAGVFQVDVDKYAHDLKAVKLRLEGLDDLCQGVEINERREDLVVHCHPGRDEDLSRMLQKLSGGKEISGFRPVTEVSEREAEVSVRGGVSRTDREQLPGDRPLTRISPEQGRAVIDAYLGKHVLKAKFLGSYGLYAIKDYPGEALQTRYHQAIQDEALLQSLGLNEYASPEVGGAFAISPVGDKDEDGNIYDVATKERKSPGAPYHWAGVVARSGADVVTLENYARGPNEEMGTADPRSYFAMYGPLRQVDVDLDNQALSAKPPAGPDSWKEGTFHNDWKGIYPNALTVAYHGGKK